MNSHPPAHNHQAVKHSSPKIAFVYDRVNTKFGGAEQVLVQLHHIFPDAPLYTSVYNPQQATWAADFKVVTSFLQHVPILHHFHRILVGFMPLAFETLDFSQFDLVISITSAEAKGVLTSPNQLHLCYLLTPTRYLWSHRAEYQRDWFTGWLRKLVFGYLRWWDRAACWRPDQIIPISKLVQARTQQFYGRQTLPVIYPPVSLLETADTSFDEKPHSVPSELPSPYFIIVARLVSYKRIDLAIQACQQLHRNLLIIGEGPDHARLQNIIHQTQSAGDANPQITIISNVSSQALPWYYQHAVAFLAPGEEDFGIAVLEAQLAGKPVIVYKNSGAAELILDQQTGLILEEQTVSDLTSKIKKLESIDWDEQLIRHHLRNYDTVQFQEQFKAAVLEQWQLFMKGRYDQ